MSFRNIINRGLVLVFLLLTVLIIKYPANVKAVTYTSVNANNNWVSGIISKAGEADFYCVELKQAGWLTVDYQGQSVDDSYYEILSYDLSESYYEKNVYHSSEISPINSSIELAMEPGKYMIKIRGYSNYTGTYRFKTNFMPANNNESNNNDLFTTAQKISIDKDVVGFISEDDRVDFFRIDVPAKKTIRIVYTSYIDDSYVQLWDKDFIEVETKNVYHANLQNPLTYVIERELEKGIYYIKIYPHSNYTGKYNLKVEEKIMTKNIAISGVKTINKGKTAKMKATFTPTNTTDKTVEWSSGDNYVAEIDRDTGVLTAKNPGKVNITASALDGSGVAKVYTIIVLPTKSAKPYVSRSYYAKGNAYVSWNSDGNVTGYKIQYSTNKKFKKAKTKTIKNSTSVTIKRLKKKKYYFRVRSYIKVGKKIYYGKWSKGTKINMK